MYPAQNNMLYLGTAMRVVLIFYRETRVQRNRRSVVTVLSNCQNEQARRGPKSLNFPDGNFQRAKTFQT